MFPECQLIELELNAPTDSFSISGSPNTGITSNSLLALATSSTITKFLSPLNVNITRSPVYNICGEITDGLTCIRAFN